MTNCTGADGTSAGDLARAHRDCRMQMEAIVAFLRRFVPGYEECYIISSASIIGVRKQDIFWEITIRRGRCGRMRVPGRGLGGEGCPF